MQDNRYKNMWGEDLAEQKKRREWLRQVYDKATKPDTIQQTPLTQENSSQTLLSTANNNFSQTSYPPLQETQSHKVLKGIANRLDNYRWKYQDKNPAIMGAGSMGLKDWASVVKTSAQGLERMADGVSLGLYTPLVDDVMGFNYRGRKNQYHREAEQAGVGGLAKGFESVFDEVVSNLGLGKYISKASSLLNVQKPTKILMDSSIGSGITEVNRNASWRNHKDDFSKGMFSSPYIKLMQYLSRH